MSFSLTNINIRIARDANHFETWSSRQNMDQVLFSDIPDALKADVTSVMNVKSKIPKGWLDSLVKSCSV